MAEDHSQVGVNPYGEGMLGLNRWRAVYVEEARGHETIVVGRLGTSRIKQLFGGGVTDQLLRDVKGFATHNLYLQIGSLSHLASVIRAVFDPAGARVTA